MTRPTYDPRQDPPRERPPLDRDAIDLVFERIRRGLNIPRPEALPRCASTACNRLFEPTRPGQRYCHRCEESTAPASVVVLHRGGAA